MTPLLGPAMARCYWHRAPSRHTSFSPLRTYVYLPVESPTRNENYNERNTLLQIIQIRIRRLQQRPVRYKDFVLSEACSRTAGYTQAPKLNLHPK
jgi:hypothetical protein